MTEFFYSFGSYEFYPGKALLLRDGGRVRLGSRALAILTRLLERTGEVVSANELIDEVWPGISVEESNLRVQIATLRRAIGDVRSTDPMIVNEAGRGYKFCAASVNRRLVRSTGVTTVGTPTPLQPPLLINDLIGREAVVRSVVGHLSSCRLVTLTGPGGIGKSSLALAAIARFGKEADRAVCFVDLTTLAEPSRVKTALAASLKLPVADDPLTALIDHLHEREMLLVLDNCEHVIVAVATLVETLLTRCPKISVLATSRESLRSSGEMLVKVPPLAVPPAGSDMSAAEAIEFPAVALFVERVAKVEERFQLTDANAAAVTSICRQLDGLPLALELAAASVGNLGLGVLLSGLDHRLSLLTHGSRTQRRHETLRAMMDWSCDLLSDQQRQALAVLSVFRARFSLDAAVSVLGRARLGKADSVDAVQHLTAKSLLVGEATGDVFTYRMLATTRAYAADLLAASPLHAGAFAGHAAYLVRYLERARLEWNAYSPTGWWEKHGWLMDDVRAALDWAFSPDGNERVGVELTVTSGPLWLGQSLLGEFRPHVRRALDSLVRTNLAGSREELQLQMWFGQLLFAAEGHSSEEISVFARVLELARRLGDLPSQITALWALVRAQCVTGDHQAAFATTARMVELTADSDDAENRLLALRMHAIAYRFKGDFNEARRIGEQIIAANLSSDTPIGHIYRYDGTTTAAANLACVLWIQGYADRSLTMIQDIVQVAIERRSSLAYILCGVACPLALWCGDEDLARYFIELLAQHAKQNAFSYMGERSAHYAVLLEAHAGLRPPPTAETLPGFRKLEVADREMLTTIAPTLIDESTISRAHIGEVSWSTSEMLRAQGERLLSVDEDRHGETAESLFQRAIHIARQQGAFAWELRAATSMARLKRGQGATTSGVAILDPVLARVVEGRDTRDVKAAFALRADLAQDQGARERR
jgi:predicted ATPase/DNA-binding winged helix-turn-helix (wHTH) protein